MGDFGDNYYKLNLSLPTSFNLAILYLQLLYYEREIIVDPSSSELMILNYIISQKQKPFKLQPKLLEFWFISSVLSKLKEIMRHSI